MKNSFPLRHVSVRVPWHDSAWNGCVCSAPELNGSCVKLKGIGSANAKGREHPLAGKSLEDLAPEEFPPCVTERGSFMAAFELTPVRVHALSQTNPKNYGHFQPTPHRYPAFSAGLVPFRWLMREQLEDLSNGLGLEASRDREPDLGYESTWVHDADNQKELLDAFAEHLRPEQSLSFFYAKHVPFIESGTRVLVGVGRVLKLAELEEYQRVGDGPRGMLWERPMQHSIRPGGKDGFLMPYQALLKAAKAEPSLDVERYVAKAPADYWLEFSYGSELVRHDAAIGALLSMDLALGRMHAELGIACDEQQAWIHQELLRLWTVRGPFPGLGAVLTAFGVARGAFVAHALQESAGEGKDPWPLVETAFQTAGGNLPASLRADVKALASTWKGLPKDRLQYLRLLSRFELTGEQAALLYEQDSRAKVGWQATDKEILSNPYRIYELSRLDPRGIGLLTIDRGVFPEDVLRLKFPLEEPSALGSAVDPRRVRAFALAALEEASLAGHTLQDSARMVTAIQALALRPPCPVTGDVLSAQLPAMAPEVVEALLNDGKGFQLGRLQLIGQAIRKEFKRVDGARHQVAVDWKEAVLAMLGSPKDPDDEKAHAEKVAALKELAEARLSVLAGPAGAGKTTVLGILCSQPEITEGNVLLLAPTGKARVRMQELTRDTGIEAKTVAQFLNQHGRYDGRAGRYILSSKPKTEDYGTVIIDESSMLTEDMMAAVLDAFKGVKRFIFVGDPAQLPPIGAGRPFLDLVSRLRPSNRDQIFPRVGKSYAELTVERRQLGSDRPDLGFARWFSQTPPDGNGDEVFNSEPRPEGPLQFVEWADEADFRVKLLETLCRELKLTGPDDVVGFNKALGAVQVGEYQYFNASKMNAPGSVNAAEAWQILSPLRGFSFGVGDINLQIHDRMRSGFMDLASRRRGRSIPKPMGAERIVYGDKVINLSNHTRGGKKVHPSEGALGYLANGEVGLAVGQWKSHASPKILRVEFSSQKNYTYDFYGSDFRDEGDAALELAYALTIHKAQGSQFDLTIVVLPVGHPMLSRELVYTALTRHKDRVVVMHQGPRARLKELAAPELSATAQRMTNLLTDCRMREIKKAKGSLFLQDGLVHVTSDGRAVRSMSELVIAEALISAGQEFSYERPLEVGGQVRYPDFTIQDDISGRTIYWEHLGMLDQQGYRDKWQKKLDWYRRCGILPESEGGGPNGMLVTTEGSGASSFDAGSVQALIRRIF